MPDSAEPRLPLVDRPYRVGELDQVARLADQAHLFAREEQAALDAVGLPAEGRGVEVGCGPGFFAAGVAGARPGLTLFGLDVDPYVLREATTRLPVVRGDASALPFTAGGCDFLCARLFFRHVPDPQRVLAGMIPLVRPGGRLVAIDVSDASLLLDPLPADWSAVAAARREWFARRGCNADMGHHLPGLLLKSGLTDVRVRIVTMTTAVVGAATFSKTVLTPFVQAADSILADPPRLAAARIAIDRWSLLPVSFGAITLFVVSGLRPGP
jgi:SAM-dependent methyltransferase